VTFDTLDSEPPKKATPWYPITYVIAAVLFVTNVAIGAIQAAYATGHGADLGITPQAQAWIAVLSTVVAAALGVLPQLTRTPAARETRYLLASQGVLPKDLEAKFPSVIAVQEPPLPPEL
jgi:hypothetical protein